MARRQKKLDGLFVPHGDMPWPADREFVVMIAGGYMMFKTEEEMDKWLASRPPLPDDPRDDEPEEWTHELPRAGKIGFHHA